MPNRADGQTVNQEGQPSFDAFGGSFNPFSSGIYTIPKHEPLDVPGMNVAQQNLPPQNPFHGGIPAMRSPFAALDARGGFQPIQPFSNPKIGEVDYKFSPVSPVRQTTSPAPTQTRPTRSTAPTYGSGPTSWEQR